MADISKCRDTECPSRAHCYRYRAKSNPYRQAYGPWKHDGEKCKMYQTTSGWPDYCLTPMNEIEKEK